MDAIASAGLKRKFEDADVGSPGSNSDISEISNSDSADSCDSVNPSSSTGFIREWSGMVPVPVPSLRVPLPSSTRHLDAGLAPLFPCSSLVTHLG